MSGVSGSRGRTQLRVLSLLIGLVVVLTAAAWAGVYGGVFDVAADTPHSQFVYWLLQSVRQHSIAARATDPVPGDLGDPKRVTAGAAQYAEMCSGCHLGPGMKRSELSQGLYPRAPELRRGSQLTPAEEFWVVKHGIKMTGMPAWGVTHKDEILWDIVAFLRKMPELKADEYHALVKSAPRTHEQIMKEMDMGKGHNDGKPDH